MTGDDMTLRKLMLLDATRYRVLRDLIVNEKWTDLPGALADLKPENEKYVTEQSLGVAIDAIGRDDQ